MEALSRVLWTISFDRSIQMWILVDIIWTNPEYIALCFFGQALESGAEKYSSRDDLLILIYPRQ